MQHRTRIPVLALVGLHFTGCTGDDDKPDPIVGDWGAVQLDGEKLPDVYSEGPYTALVGLRMIIEDDLVGAFEYYSVLDYDDYEYRHSYGSELIVDDSAAPKYRVEVQKNFLGDDVDYTDSVGMAVTSDGYDSGYLGDDSSAIDLAAPGRPIVAPAELILTCTLDQDLLTCSGGDLKSLVFKRQVPVKPQEG
ncbi:hypothetical protein SAMN02745121_03087 [Nannocystis exedens]|uniref:Uncharacterized protein n=1 Tax=Nannocystis exedens TaxID=54 RepID=A0A1I1Y1T7_9BACT|nr:hypothetical protein [Nannocystis exedens]PCC71734.1 hypothetical protein NAEX_04813 [Nannocystis exedens]SFE12978.1 hypothetical protein SAMN02745121_03087 [Nannocystis exedens]